MKRILVISPGSFDCSDNDGLTLSNLFQGWSKDNIAQFYIQGMEQNTDVCDNFYNITDRQALKAFFTGGIIHPYNNCKCLNGHKIVKENNKRFKSPLNMLLRNIIWDSKRWKTSDFDNWIEFVSPEVIFLEIGDNSSQIKLACQIAKQRKIPLIIHNTEAFYFLRKNYMPKKSLLSNLFFPLFKKQLERAYNVAMNQASACIYSCEKLKALYDSYFPFSNSYVLYNSSNTIATEKKASKSLVISYVGNLGFNRPLALIEVAKELQSINKNLICDVYGKANNLEIEKLLSDMPGIKFHGVIPYEKAKEVIATSHILLHVEHPSCVHATEYGFSTKIPDSLASGSCFIVYSPISVAGIQYLHDNIPEVVATSKNELRMLLQNVINDVSYREQCIKKELSLAHLNHNAAIISQKFINIVNKL